MLFLFPFLMVPWLVAGIRTVDLSTACKANSVVELTVAPFSMSAVIFRYGSRSVPLPPAFVHKMPSSWPLRGDIDDSAESGEDDRPKYIFENHEELDDHGESSDDALNSSGNLTSSRSKRGIFTYSRTSGQSCTFRLSYSDQDISGIYFAVEDISLDSERTCSEFIEVSGTTIYDESTDRRICGKDLTSASAKSDSFQEVFVGNVTIKVSINPSVGNSMYRFVVTGFQTGEKCSPRSLFQCPTTSYRPEYDALKMEPLCVWGGLQCDSHLNCPFDAFDEKGQKCPKTNLLKQRQSLYLQSKQEEDMANLSRLVLGISIFFICVICIITGQVIAARRKVLARDPDEPSELVTVAVTPSSATMNAPPPSYSDVMCPPPAYDTIIGVDNLLKVAGNAGGLYKNEASISAESGEVVNR